MAEQSTFARRMMAQKLMTEKRDDPFSDSPFFSVPKGQPKRISDFAQFGKPALGSITPYQVGATGSLFAPGAGIADVMGYAPDPMQSGQMLPSFGENIGQGKYLDAGLQTLGVAGDVLQAGGAFVPPLAVAGTMLKAPRAARVADAAMDAADAAKIDPNEAAGAAMDLAQARYFETGKFEPPTAENPVSIVPPKPDEPGIIAFHGSGADFDEFRLEMIGTGEGAQAYGYGLYFTDSEDIAKFYRDTVQYNQRMRASTLNIKYQGEPFKDLGDTAAAEAAPPSYRAIKSIADEMAAYLPANPKMAKPEAAKDRILSRIDADIERYSKAGQADADVGTIELRGGGTLEELLLADLQQQKQALLAINSDDIQPATGKMYKVGLAPKPDELLDYDLPLSQQPKMLEKIKAGIASTIDENVAQFLKEINIDPAVSTGGDLEKALDGLALGPNAHGTKELASFGIPGIKFFSGNTRNTAGGKLIDVAETTEGFRAKVAVDNRAGGLGGSGRVVTTSQPYKTKQQALDWADEAIKNKESNYVIFDDKAVKILEKYGIVGPVAVTAAGAAAVNRGRNDNDNGGSILPDAGIM